MDNAILIDLKNPIKENLIDRFGGVIAIGEIICGVEEMEKTEIYFGKKNKLNYVVWNFSNKTFKIEKYLKKRFRSEKLKATQKKISEDMILQSGKKVKNLSSSRLIDEQYFVFNNYFGKIIQKSNYEEIEKRDMKKPVRREKLSISPRLAKIMINLSQVKPGEKLVDCFCGIGVILQEALLQRIKIIGIDKDKKAIEGAKRNLQWAGFKNYKLINFDSKKVEIEKVEALVSEPDLGKILKKMPTKEEAQQSLRDYESLMIEVLNNLKNKISGRLVFTAPLIKNFKKRIFCNVEKILNLTGLKLVKGFPISEFRKNQVVGRQIFVLRK